MLPARYFGPEAEKPAPPAARVVQIMPAPKGCKVKMKKRGAPSHTLTPFCLALVEHPKSNCNKLDAFVTHPSQLRDCLASEVFGDQTTYTEISMSDNGGWQNIMQVPEDVQLEAEIWNDKEDHSKGSPFFRNPPRSVPSYQRRGHHRARRLHGRRRWRAPERVDALQQLRKVHMNSDRTRLRVRYSMTDEC